MAIEILLNHKLFKFNDHHSLIEGWDHLVDKSGWQGTGGDWRGYALTVERLYQEANKSRVGFWCSWWQPYNPTIAVRIV
jgi:hypothetical protein